MNGPRGQRLPDYGRGRYLETLVTRNKVLANPPEGKTQKFSKVNGVEETCMDTRSYRVHRFNVRG